MKTISLKISLNSLGFEADNHSNNKNDTIKVKSLRIFISLVIFLQGMAQAFSANTPAFPGVAPALIAVKPYRPALICGLKTFQNDPFKVEFIFNQGDSEYTSAQKQAESQKAIDYFLAALTMPNNKMWVNLSPYEQERIIPDNLSVTEMGKTMLEVDYELKQFSAALSDPRTKLGRIFWDKVYQKIGKRYGTTQIPIGTFNKVWIVPAQAEVQENNDTAFVASSSLEVLLDEDYLALNQQKSGNSTSANAEFTQVMREVILPVLQEEVNKGEHFAALRQMYSAFILAVWFKRQVHEQSWAKNYADQEKVTGIDLVSAKVKEKVYQKYLQACNEGAYNYIQKERVGANDHSPVLNKIVTRHYFSGGLSWENLQLVTRKTALSLRVPGKGWMSGTTFVPVASLSTAAQAQIINKAPRILLVYPRLKDQEYEPTRVPTGLMALDSVVSSKEFLAKYYHKKEDMRFSYDSIEDYPDAQVTILDLQAEKEDFDFAAYIRKENPDIVGFGAVTATINPAQRLAATVKTVCPNAVTVVGGHHVSSLPEETMKDSAFDAGVVGEGREPFCDIMMYWATGKNNFSEIPGIVVKNGKFSSAQRREPIMDLDDYPWAAKSLKDLHNFSGYAFQYKPNGEPLGRMGTIVTSEGCTNNCSFCAAKSVTPRGKKKLRLRSAESVFGEMLYQKDWGIENISALDDVFMPNKETLFKLAEVAEKYYQKTGTKMGLAVFMRADMVDEETIAALEKIGCGAVSLGVEVGDEKVLNEAGNKGLKLEQVLNATRLLKKAKPKIVVKWFTMVGLNGWESVERTAEFIRQGDPDTLDVAQLVPYPGSDLFGKLELVEGVTWDDYNHGPEPQAKLGKEIKAIIKTKYMSDKEIMQARKFLLRAHACRNDAHKFAEVMSEIRAQIQQKDGGLDFDAQALKLTVRSTSTASRQFDGNAIDNLVGVTASIDYIKPWGIK